jgi:hypothetical protein
MLFNPEPCKTTPCIEKFALFFNGPGVTRKTLFGPGKAGRGGRADPPARFMTGEAVCVTGEVWTD